MVYKRNALDKLKTLLFWRDIRVTQGEPYTEIRKFDYTTYLPLENYIRPAEPPSENVYDIRNFGARANDTSFDNAPAINSAFEEAEKTGGTVLVAGGSYTSTTVFLKSGTALFIERGSCIIANEPGKGYLNRALVYGENLDNITLTGGGSINGNGHLFGRRPVSDENMTAPKPYVDVIEMRQDYRKQLRFAHESKYGSPVVLVNCSGVCISNFMIENSAYWTLRLDRCRSAEISDLVINNNRNTANADGIDLMGTSDVIIRHCFISTADDGIVIKNALWEGCCAPMKNISISDCEIISRTNAIKVGTETTHDISSINIENCRLFMTDVYPGSVSAVSLEAVDGARLYDVHIKDIISRRCSCPLFIRLGNRNRAAKVNEQSARAVEFGEKADKGTAADRNQYDFKSEIFDITVENFEAFEVEMPIMICGFKQRGRVKRVKNVSLRNISLEFTERPFITDKRLFIPEYAKEYPEANRFRNLPCCALFVRHAENIKINGLKCVNPPSNRAERYFKDVL